MSMPITTVGSVQPADRGLCPDYICPECGRQIPGISGITFTGIFTDFFTVISFSTTFSILFGKRSR